MNSMVRIGHAFRRLGVGRSAGYEQQARGLIPRCIKLGERAAALLESEIETINTARAAGASDADLKKIVDRLHARRKAAAVELLSGDSPAPAGTPQAARAVKRTGAVTR